MWALVCPVTEPGVDFIALLPCVCGSLVALGFDGEEETVDAVEEQDTLAADTVGMWCWCWCWWWPEYAAEVACWCGGACSFNEDGYGVKPLYINTSLRS